MENRYTKEEWGTLINLPPKEYNLDNHYFTIERITHMGEVAANECMKDLLLKYSKESFVYFIIYNLHKSLFCSIDMLPLEINGFFKEIIKWRMEHGK
jgi:hypothetical protein